MPWESSTGPLLPAILGAIDRSVCAFLITVFEDWHSGLTANFPLYEYVLEQLSHAVSRRADEDRSRAMDG